MNLPFIFLSYAREDQPKVHEVYCNLKDAGLQPWMDDPPAPYKREHIPPGELWDNFIAKKIEAASYFIAFLSRSSAKQGYVHNEFALALNRLSREPVSRTWIIPVTLEDCQPPPLKVEDISLDQLQWYDLAKHGVGLLIEHLKASIFAGDEIGTVHLALIHSSWRAPQHDKRFPGKSIYRFDVIISADHSIMSQSATEDTLGRIERVTYLLPPEWPTSPVTIADRRTSFGLKELAWADLMVRANVYVAGQQEPVHLSSYIRLTESGPRLV